jgi:hypothetical protein
LVASWHRVEGMRKGAIIALLALLGSADAAKKKGAKSEKQ